MLRGYGFHPTASLFAAVSVLSGAALFVAVRRNGPGLDELAEVPLMGAMFLAMAWHAIRARILTAELLEMSEREREFIRNMAHELRTTITIARGHTELIRAICAHQPTRAERVVLAEDADVVLEELTALARISNRLMLLASSNQPDFVQPARLDLASLLEGTVRRWRVVAPRAWSVDSAEGSVEGDAERLTTALDALLENAIRHTQPEDGISLRARPSGDSIVIELTDTGEGIPDEKLSSIFDRRYSRSRGEKGAGLGLAIVRAIVEAHGGSVQMSSILGEGTTVRVELPHFASSSRDQEGGSFAPTELLPTVALAERVLT
jgi:signal transduction histidine kinase